MYQSCTSLCSYTTTDHLVPPEFVPKSPPVLAGLKNQGELPSKVHMIFLDGIILFYNHSVGNVSMFFPVWLFLFFPYTDVLEVCLKPKLWTLFADVGFSCNMIQFWCVTRRTSKLHTLWAGAHGRTRVRKSCCRTGQSWQWERAANGQCPLPRTAAAESCFACTILIRQGFPKDSIK